MGFLYEVGDGWTGRACDKLLIVRGDFGRRGGLAWGYGIPSPYPPLYRQADPAKKRGTGCDPIPRNAL